ncbi:MAG TPA: EamA family transporter [Methylomirabilota bacterium]|nr:EamA family transporter [Methylomirabilota bacterium]
MLAAAALHAAWNLTLHDAPDREAAMAVAGVAAGLALLPATLLWAPWSVLPLIALSALAEALYALALAAAYRRGALAVAYPLARGTAPLLVTVGGWFVLAEQPAPQAALGAVGLAVGLALIADVGRRSRQRAAVAFALVTGVAIAVYSVIDARAVREVKPAAYLGAVMLLQGVLLSLWIGLDRRRLGAALGPGLRIAVGSTAAYLLVLLALQRAQAGRVATLREVSILIALLIAGSGHGRRTWIGAALVALGAILAAI